MKKRKAGRPRNDETESYLKKLKWFRIDRYKRAMMNALSLEEWYEQILFRKHVLEQVLLVPQYCSPREFYDGDYGDLSFRSFISLIQTDPIVSFADLQNRGWNANDELFKYRERLRQRSLLAAYPTTIEEIHLCEANADPSLVKNARAFFGELSRCAREYSKASSRDFTETLYEAWVERKIDQRMEGEPFRYSLRKSKSIYNPAFAKAMTGTEVLRGKAVITLDLQAPDRLILGRLERLLPALRRSTKTVRAATFSTEAWATCGLLPYADLQIWRLINALPYSGEDCEELPRTVLKKLVYLPHLKVTRSGAVPSRTSAHFNAVFVDSWEFEELEARLAEQFDDQHKRESFLTKRRATKPEIIM